jgi:hypothetical protein
MRTINSPLLAATVEPQPVFEVTAVLHDLVIVLTCQQLFSDLSGQLVPHSEDFTPSTNSKDLEKVKIVKLDYGLNDSAEIGGQVTFGELRHDKKVYLMYRSFPDGLGNLNS